MITVLNTRSIRDISGDVLEPSGEMRILPASWWAATTKEERALFGAKHAMYGLPSQELIAFVHGLIDGRRAIEIGSGNGVLADALGIQGTDNHMQADPIINAIYTSSGQRPITYGANVVNMDALAAIEHYKPQVVVAQWVTHLYEEGRHEAGGNMFGVDEDAVIDSVEAYIFIGNEEVHKGKKIWKRPHQIIRPDWLYSRAMNPSKNFIAIWGK